VASVELLKGLHLHSVRLARGNVASHNNFQIDVKSMQIVESSGGKFPS
jgi:hypothetical protein